MDINLIKSKKAYIFDVDGTLYSQKRMRLLMAKKLIKHCASSVHGTKDILIILHFRSCREKPEFQQCSLDTLYEIVAKKFAVPAQKVEQVIDKWMFVTPLEVIKKCCYNEVLSLIEELQQANKQVLFYSDYQLADKLEALGISYDGAFCPDGENITELKPSKTAMEYVLSHIDCEKKDIIMIGDRNEKDGESATIVGIDFCNVREIINEG